MPCTTQIQVKESLPLSRRLRVNVAGVSSAAHALPRGPARSSPSVPAIVAFLDWFGEKNYPCADSKCLETVVTFAWIPAYSTALVTK